MKDLYNKLSIVQAIAPVLVLDATVPDPVEVDLADFSSAVIEISCGDKVVGDTGTITVKLEHADDDGAGSADVYDEIEAADVQGATPSEGTGLILTLASGAVDAAVYKIGYLGGKRFMKLTVAENDGNATGTIVSISVIKGHPIDAPV
jgi:hypothetical protein